MPQMMPMMWTHTMLISLTCLMFLICLTYFLYLPYYPPYSYLNAPSNWIWKW